MVKAFRAEEDATPIVLMGYYNPIYVYPVDRFLADAVAAGVDGLIVVDMPPEEDAELRPLATEAGLNFIRLATPTTDAKRLPAVLANTFGICLLRLDRWHHRHGGARHRPRSRPMSAASRRRRAADRGRLRREDGRAGERDRRARRGRGGGLGARHAPSPKASMMTARPRRDEAAGAGACRATCASALRQPAEAAAL